MTTLVADGASVIENVLVFSFTVLSDEQLIIRNNNAMRLNVDFILFKIFIILLQTYIWYPKHRFLILKMPLLISYSYLFVLVHKLASMMAKKNINFYLPLNL